jgi:branched-chain amino acid transport system substrate-binding protein
MRRFIRLFPTLAFACIAGSAIAQGTNKEVRVGVLYDLTGPMASSGSYPSYLGTKYAIEMFNARGGVDGYTIKPIYVDAQSKVETAINATERLINQEKVDILLGVFPSSQCVPLAQKADQSKIFMWANICVSSAVFKDKNLKYVFRPQVDSDQFGPTSCEFLREFSKSKLGKDVKDLKVAIIYEDSPYGVGVSSGNESACKERGMQIVLKEGYSAATPDLSSLVTKLKRARADVILHTGQGQDITLFLRQARDQGLKWQALIGHGAGYGLPDKLYAAVQKDADYIFDVEPVGAELVNSAKLAPGLGDLVTEITTRYRAETKAEVVPPFVSMGFNGTWVFLNDVLPRAIRKYGGADAESLRKAALETDIPEGGTIQGFGVKFFPPGHVMAGQNSRASMPVVQYVDQKAYIVSPTVSRTREPVLPLPSTNGYAAAR